MYYYHRSGMGQAYYFANHNGPGPIFDGPGSKLRPTSTVDVLIYAITLWEQTYTGNCK